MVLVLELSVASVVLWRGGAGAGACAGGVGRCSSLGRSVVWTVFFLRPFFRGRSGPSSTASCRTSGALALGRALSFVLGNGIAPSVGLIESLGCFGRSSC